MVFSMGIVPRRWLQVDFDIPENRPSARLKLVDAIYCAGGRRLSLSVYHMPYSDAAMEALKEAAKIPGAVVHVVRPEYEVADAQDMAQRYIDDVVTALNHAEQVTQTAETELADGKLESDKAVSKLKRMIELIDLTDAACQRIGDKQLDIQRREVRAYVVSVVTRISPRAMAGAGVKAWATRRANEEKRKQEAEAKPKSKKPRKTAKAKRKTKKQQKEEKPATESAAVEAKTEVQADARAEEQPAPAA